jgi:probable AcnD-accessory protein PrpF
MRGGTSKGVFFRQQDLPDFALKPGSERDHFLKRVIGSPDPYEKQTDGMGGATSSTSKIVILDKSQKQNHDVDYFFGQIAIDGDFVDWSGNCGNLTAAVGAFAINQGLVDPERIPQNGCATVRIWQANIKKSILAHIPITDGNVQETGDFELDGVAFPAAEIAIEFLDPAEGDGALFPTGNIIDELSVPEVGNFEATFINAGIPTIFLKAEDLGYSGTELQGDINGNSDALKKLETIRAYGAIKMGLIDDISEAAVRQHTPKIAFVSPPQQYSASSGKTVNKSDIDVCARAMSMGKLHHAMMGTAAVSIAAAASVPGTIVNLAAGGGERNSVRFGHPSGVLRVGAEAEQNNNEWQVTKVMMSRSARVLMEGWVRVPQ